MDETPNVNNLNGVPNFGHGFPADASDAVAEQDVVAADPNAVDASVDPATDISEETKDAGDGVVELQETNDLD